MKSISLILLSIFVLFSSLVVKSQSTYYLCIADSSIRLYKGLNQDTLIVIIPKDSQFVAKDNKPLFRQIVFGQYSGYAKSQSYSFETSFSSTMFKYYQYNYDKTRMYDPDLKKHWIKTDEVEVNNTTTSTQTPQTSSGGSVQVKGYYRKDGTYVQPYTRSAPTRRH